MLRHWQRILQLRLRSLFQKSQVERELDEELQYHLEMKIEEHAANGMSREEARRLALIALDGMDLPKEACRDARGINWAEEVFRNFRYSCRRLVKSPLPSLMIVFSLALGIGANTAVFSVMHHTLLQSLPVEKPGELARVTALGSGPAKLATGNISGDDSGESSDAVFSYPGFRLLESQRQSYAELAGYAYSATAISYNKTTSIGTILLVSGGYFPLMRLHPHLGRTLVPTDDLGNGNPVVMLGYDFWKNKLGGRMDVLNKTIGIAGQLFTVVGVAPKGFYGTTLGYIPSAYLPLANTITLSKTSHILGNPGNPNGYWLYLIARIKPGVQRKQIEAYYAGAYNNVVEQAIQSLKNRPGRARIHEIDQYRKSRIRFVDGAQGYSALRKEIKPALFILMAVTALVLLIALANAANLLIARFAARRRELSICAAVGARRRHIAGQLLTEALTVSILGGVIAVPLSLFMLKFFHSISAQAGSLENVVKADLAWPALLLAAALSLVAGLLIGLLPALQSAAAMPNKVLIQESGRGSEALSSARLRKTLVCTQVAIAAILLIPTGLFLKSMANLMKVDLGLKPENLITFSLTPDSSGYSSAQSRLLYKNVEQKLGAIPGVRSIAMAVCPLISNMQFAKKFTIRGQAGKSQLESSFNSVSPGFFGHMGIPLLQGREFTEFDNLSAPPVAVVNELFAKTFFGGRNPIGQQLDLNGRSSGPVFSGQMPASAVIVGIVKNSRDFSVDQKLAPAFYIPWQQHQSLVTMTYYIRSSSSAAQSISAARKAVHSTGAGLPLHRLRTMEDQIRTNTAGARFITQLAGIAAALAAALAMMGLYGAMAYSIVRRAREIGIRMAIGAKPDGIFKMILHEALMILAIGLAIGIPSALAASKILESRFFGVTAFDPAVLMGSITALGLAVLAAAFIPALRASRIDPLRILRHE